MMKRTVAGVVAAAVVVLASVSDSRAVDEDVVRCRTTVLRGAGAYVKNELLTVQKCADKRASGVVPGSVDCTDPVAAHTALGTTAPSSVFASDPSAVGGSCQSIPPSAAYYGACPAPCAAIATTDWNGVSDCMQCVVEEVVGKYANDVIGAALLPAAPEERACLKSASAAGSRIVGALQRSNEKCQKRGSVPPFCERTDDKGRATLRKARAAASTAIAAACAEADFARIGGCASSVSDAGCVVASAERRGRDLVHAISRLLAPEPEVPAADFTQVRMVATFVPYYPHYEDHMCALRSDGSAMCWGPGAQPVPGRYSRMSVGCWRREDGSADCLADRGSGGYALTPPSGSFLQIEGHLSGSCGLRADGTIECWGDVRYRPHDAGPFSNFAMNGGEFCAIRADGSLTCWADLYETGDVDDEYDVPGPFTSVSLGYPANCGIRTDSSIECWARGYPDATVPEELEPPSGTFLQVSVGNDSACAVRTDGTLACWGSDYAGKSTPPSGTFSSVETGYSYFCAIRTDGTLACWGDNASSQASVPGESAVALSRNGRCALRSDASVDCWGEDPSGPATPPAGSFTDISAGFYATCAIDSGDQSIECWGYDAPGHAGSYIDMSATGPCALQSDGVVQCWSGVEGPGIPTGTFLSLAEGIEGRRCGIRSDNTLVCSVSNNSPSADWAAVLPGTFVQAAYGWGQGCGVRTTGVVDCWLDYYPYSSPAILPAGTYSMVGVGSEFTCGILTDGTIACAARGGSIASSPAGTFVQLSLGESHGCAVRTDGTVACWGDDLYGETLPPAGTFTKVAAGNDYTCGLRPDGSVECWGWRDRGQASPPDGSYLGVDANEGVSCGLLGDGSLTCWGFEPEYYPPGVPVAPAGTYSDVSIADRIGCAVHDDGALECWGDVMPTPPIGTFTQVSAGGGTWNYAYGYYYGVASPHACAIRSDQSVACWGDDSFGQSTPRFGTYQQISAAAGATCGLTTDGELACWGENLARSRLPAGQFVEIAAGDASACALRTDGTIACWGDDSFGQATPPTELFAHVYMEGSYACGIRPDSTYACWGSILRP